MLNPIKSPHEMLLQSAGIPTMAGGGSTGDVKGPFSAAVSKFKVIFNRAPNAEEMAQIEAHAHKHVQGFRTGRQVKQEAHAPTTEEIYKFLDDNPMRRQEFANYGYPYPRKASKPMTEAAVNRELYKNPTYSLLSSAESLPEEHKRETGFFKPTAVQQEPTLTNFLKNIPTRTIGNITPTQMASHYANKVLPQNIADYIIPNDRVHLGIVPGTIQSVLTSPLTWLDNRVATNRAGMQGDLGGVLIGNGLNALLSTPAIGAKTLGQLGKNIVNPLRDPTNYAINGIMEHITNPGDGSLMDAPRPAPQVSPEDMIPNIL